MVEHLFKFYKIPKDERSFLILAGPRTGSSVFFRALLYASNAKSINIDGIDNEEKFKSKFKNAKGCILKIDPTDYSPEFMDYLINEFDRVVVLIRENIVDQSLSMSRAAHYTYDGVYNMDSKLEKEIKARKYNQHSLVLVTQLTLFKLQLAFKYKLPILTYESIYTGEEKDVVNALITCGIKIGRREQEKLETIKKVLHPKNKYTNKDSIIIDTKLLLI